MISRSSLSNKLLIRRLGEVVEFLDNMRRPVTESERKSGPYPYYGANGQQGSIDDYLFDEPLVLLAEDGGHFDDPSRGIAYRISGKTWVNNHAHVLRAKQDIDISYLCRVLENYDAKPFVTGTTRGKLTKAGASEIPIPIPSLLEQRRIAKILDKADALRARRRKALAQLDKLIQSIFNNIFGDPISNSKGYNIVSLGDVCDVRDGTHDSPKYVDKGFPLVTSKNLKQGFVDLSEANLISEADYASINKRSKVDIGDILMPMIGTIGNPVLVNAEPTYAIKNVALIKFPKDAPSNIYIHSLLSGSYFDYIVSRKNRGGTQKFLSLGDLRSIPIPLPPQNMQDEFAKKNFALENLKIKCAASLAEFDILFVSLQHRAFRGEL